MMKRSLPFSPKAFALGCATAAAVAGSAPAANAQTIYTKQYGPAGGNLNIFSMDGSAGPLGPLALNQFNNTSTGPIWGTGGQPGILAPVLLGASLTISSGMYFTQSGSVSGFLSSGTITLSALGSLSLVDSGVFPTATVTVGEHTVTASTGSSGIFGSSSGAATWSSGMGSTSTVVPTNQLNNFIGTGGTLGVSVYMNDHSSAAYSGGCYAGSCGLTSFYASNLDTSVYINYTYKFVPGPSSALIYLPSMSAGLAAIWRRKRRRA